MVSQKERERRCAAIRQAMQMAGCDVLLVAGNAEPNQRGYIRYLSDWRLWGGTGYLVFPLEGEPTLILGWGSQAYWAKAVGWVRDVRPALDKIAEAGSLLRTLELKQGTVGAVGLNRVMPWQDIETLKQALPHARIQDATALMDQVMAIKSQEEIAQVAETFRFVAQGLDSIASVLRPGKTEREVMAEAVRTLAGFGCLDGIAHISNAAPPFMRPPTDRPIARDEQIKVALEFSGPSGHWIELGTIFSFQDPPAREGGLFDTARESVRRATTLMRPGARAGEIVKEVEETFREAGLEVTGRVIWDIHGIGLNVIEAPIGMPESQEELKENMVINIHPGLVVGPDQWGIYMYDNLVVTREGSRRLMPEYRHEWRVISA